MRNGPPPLFKQGMPALIKALIYVAAALFLIFADARLHMLSSVRHAVATVLYPIESLALLPRTAADTADEFLTLPETVQAEYDALRKKQLEDAPLLSKSQMLENENAHLRSLLSMKQRMRMPSVAAEILYEARNPFARKVIINAGSSAGVQVGQPVVDGDGVIGQISEVFPTSSEVILLTDRDQVIPVLNARSSERGIVYGRGQSGYLDLHFMRYDADFKSGDKLITSGIDGVYPAGLEVATVTQNISDSTRPGWLICENAAGISKNRQVLVLLADMRYPERPKAKSESARPTSVLELERQRRAAQKDEEIHRSHAAQEAKE